MQNLKSQHKILALLLAVMLAVGMMPVTVFAAETVTKEPDDLTFKVFKDIEAYRFGFNVYPSGSDSDEHPAKDITLTPGTYSVSVGSKQGALESLTAEVTSAEIEDSIESEGYHSVTLYDGSGENYTNISFTFEIEVEFTADGSGEPDPTPSITSGSVARVSDTQARVTLATSNVSNGTGYAAVTENPFADPSTEEAWIELIVGEAEDQGNTFAIDPAGNLISGGVTADSKYVYVVVEDEGGAYTNWERYDLSAESGGDEQPTVHTVTFNLNGGTRTGGGELTQPVADGGTATAPTVTRSNYSFSGWDNPLTNITSSQTITAQWAYIGYSGGSSSDNDDDDRGSSGGGSSSNGGRSTTATGPSNVTTASANSAVNSAIAAAQVSGAANATATLRNPGDISLATLQSMANQAGDTELKVNADSINGNAVDVRVTFNPAQATSALDLSASTVNADARNVNAVFDRFFSNDVMTVALGQEGSFGMPVQIAAKLDPTLNTENLVFYAYNRETNSFARIEAPEYWIDANGYVHFVTSLGGNVVISDGALARR